MTQRSVRVSSDTTVSEAAPNRARGRHRELRVRSGSGDELQALLWARNTTRAGTTWGHRHRVKAPPLLDPRRELVAVLAETGMSTRAIAPVVGVNQATVVRDLSPDASASPAGCRVLPLDCGENADTL